MRSHHQTPSVRRGIGAEGRRRTAPRRLRSRAPRLERTTAWHRLRDLLLVVWSVILSIAVCALTLNGTRAVLEFFVDLAVDGTQTVGRVMVLTSAVLLAGASGFGWLAVVRRIVGERPRSRQRDAHRRP